MSYRGVATMAFMVALAANIGVETMIGCSRDTTDRWMSQRLAPDIYLYPSNSVASRMSQWPASNLKLTRFGGVPKRFRIATRARTNRQYGRFGW